MNAKKSASALQAELDAINKQFGEGTVVRMSDHTHTNLEVVSSGVLPLDIALDCGGYPRGRIIEVYGGESVGKSTLALHAVASFQQAGTRVLYVDTEHSLDTVYAKSLGVDVDALLVSQPDCGEEALEIVERLGAVEEVGLVVVDSVAVLTPRSEIEGDYGAAHVGAHARLMSQAMRKLSAVLPEANTTSLWINQLRTKVGVVYGPSEVTPGGRALPFYASIRLQIFGGTKEKIEGEPSHNRMKIKVAKNKCGRPFRQIECDLEYGIGISPYGCLLDVGEQYGLIQKSGSWFTYTGEQLGQGRVKAKAFLSEHPETCAEIEKRIREASDVVE
jgi:recombination protein RecA